MIKPVSFNNTVLRDGHQSLAATRASTEQLLPVVADLDTMGFHALETWGGATIDSCLRFLGENPFERITRIKELSPKTPHSMLLRGQNIVQYTGFPDDVVEAFVRCTARRGMDIFRIFDALNDVRNIETAVQTVIKEGKHAQGTISYTVSPVHTIEAFVELGVQLEAMGCHSVCVKDMAGLITPQMAGGIIKSLKKKVGIPLVLHSHSTAGLAPSSYLAAIEAGVDEVDVSVAPFANGSGQPDVQLMLAMLDGTPRCPSYHLEKLPEVQKHLWKVYGELDAFTSRTSERVDIGILQNQIPGGMLSNFVNQLKEQGMSDQLDAVLAEMPYVRKCLGYIPLVTPTSQIVGTQAALNVKFGRWHTISQPCVDIVLGKYGRTPAPIHADLLDLVRKKTGAEPIEGRPADGLPPRMPALLQELAAKGLPADEETAVLYAMFPTQVADLHAGKKPVPTSAAPAASASAKAPTDVISTRHFRLYMKGTSQEATVEELA